MNELNPLPFTSRSRLLLGVSAGLLAGASYGVAGYLARKIVTEQGSPLVAATYGLLIGMIILALLSFRTLPTIKRAPKRSLFFLGISGAGSAGGVIFILMAMNIAPIVIVAPVVATQPLFALTLTHLFLKRLERVTLQMWAGTTMVVGGVILIIFGSI
jgi:drug/metabolite transporter (DMT)-like permease